jgi:hypothetical protein
MATSSSTARLTVDEPRERQLQTHIACKTGLEADAFNELGPNGDVAGRSQGFRWASTGIVGPICVVKLTKTCVKRSLVFAAPNEGKPNCSQMQWLRGCWCLATCPGKSLARMMQFRQQLMLSTSTLFTLAPVATSQARANGVNIIAHRKTKQTNFAKCTHSTCDGGCKRGLVADFQPVVSD